MEVAYGFDRENQQDSKGRLIEDIVERRVLPGFDVRSSGVRRQSIGYLNDEYWDRAQAFAGAHESRLFGYTRVPPLSTLGFDFNPLRGRLANAAARVFSRINALRLAALAAVMAFAGAIKRPIVRRLPKRYSLQEGQYIDWQALQKTELRYAVILATFIGVIVGLTVMLHPFSPKSMPTRHHGGSTSKTKTTDARGGQAKSPQSSPGASKPAAVTPSPTNTAASSPQNSQASTAYSASTSATTATASSQPAGSKGSGTTTYSSSSAPTTTTSTTSSPSTSSGSTGSSSPLPTSTVSVPPTSISLGGKTLINLSGTSLSVN